MNLASYIDHTLLKPDATIEGIRKLCAEAVEHGFFSVCINPYWISTAKPLLKGSSVKICTVIGFPLGSMLPQTKAHETEDVILAGAEEVDMVMNVGAALEGHWNFIEHEIHEVVTRAKHHPVKVILETCLLSPAQIELACKACLHGGASFVKTSTGFSTGGATVEAVSLMRKTVGQQMGVKASGGVRNADDARAMIDAGANRLGTSASVAIVSGTTSAASY